MIENGKLWLKMENTQIRFFFISLFVHISIQNWKYFYTYIKRLMNYKLFGDFYILVTFTSLSVSL